MEDSLHEFLVDDPMDLGAIGFVGDEGVDPRSCEPVAVEAHLHRVSRSQERDPVQASPRNGVRSHVADVEERHGDGLGDGVRNDVHRVRGEEDQVCPGCFELHGVICEERSEVLPPARRLHLLDP